MAGITVLDLSHIYNGPYATFLMAMAGATVIKIEPRGGEHMRKRDTASGAGVAFAMLNANKLSVTIDLKTPDGLGLFGDMARKADVVVENFAPGVIDRLGIGYDALRELNPAIILASGSGYGQTGRYRSMPAMDLSVQAMSGTISATGFPDGDPVKAGPAICDFFGGVHLYGAIATALLHRERNGVGSRVDVAMLEAVYPSMASNIGALYSKARTLPERTGNHHGGMSLCPYSVYPTRDGYLAIICSNDNHWRLLAEAMGRPELGHDARYATMSDRAAKLEEVDGLVAAWSSTFDREALFAKLLAHRVPTAPVRRLREVLTDPHLRERGMLFDIDHPEYGQMVACRSPLNIDSAPQPDYRPSAALGANNESVYRGIFGLDAGTYKTLLEQGVI